MQLHHLPLKLRHSSRTIYRISYICPRNGLTKIWTAYLPGKIGSGGDAPWKGTHTSLNSIPKIYLYLKEHGHLLEVLNDKSIYHLAKDKVVSEICFAYCCGIESLAKESDLISVVISRNKKDELIKFVLEFWRIGKRDVSRRPSILAFWSKVLSTIDLDTREGQSVASYLCMLSEIIAEIDESNFELICKVAPYASLEYHDYDMIEWLETVSKRQPVESYEIWSSMIDLSLSSEPENSIKNLLKNIVEGGEAGISQAHNIVKKYAERGNVEPYQWLRKILKDEDWK